MNWYKIAQSSNNPKTVLLWKHHLASHFENGTAPRKNNGVGKGGTLFKNFENMVRQIGRNKYWVIPILMTPNEFNDLGHGIVESKVAKLGIGDFAPISYWEKNNPSII